MLFNSIGYPERFILKGTINNAGHFYAWLFYFIANGDAQAGT
jgi:hypothetical protein